jgi:hypothetical protein
MIKKGRGPDEDEIPHLLEVPLDDYHLIYAFYFLHKNLNPHAGIF